MLTFFTTTTGPPWSFTATDELGNTLPVTGASFRIYFVNVSNNQKTQGNSNLWTIVDGPNGIFQYQLSNTDLANAYATTGSSSPGTAIFDACVEITIGSEVYDPSPSRIMIRKI